MANPPCEFREVPLEEIDVRFDDQGPVVGRKALAWPKRKTIAIDHSFWLSVPTVQGRAGLLAHERGHIEGARCEPCADRRAGEILRREGWVTARDAQATALAKLENRDAAAAAADIGAAFGADGFLQNRDRADGVDSELQAFLDELASTGLSYGGRTWYLTVGLHGGVRTDAEQFELYKQGRKLSSSSANPSDWRSWVPIDPVKRAGIVTDAPTVDGGAKHPLGKAVDLWILGVDGQPMLFPRDAIPSGVNYDGVYAALGARGKARGLTWGGDWKGALIDLAHFEVSPSSPSRPVASGGDNSSSGFTPPPLLSVDVGDVAAGFAVIAAALIFVAFA